MLLFKSIVKKSFIHNFTYCTLLVYGVHSSCLSEYINIRAVFTVKNETKKEVEEASSGIGLKSGQEPLGNTDKEVICG